YFESPESELQIDIIWKDFTESEGSLMELNALDQANENLKKNIHPSLLKVYKQFVEISVTQFKSGLNRPGTLQSFTTSPDHELTAQASNNTTFIMTGIRHTQPAVFTRETNYSADNLDYAYRPRPLPSSGILSVMQSFCPKSFPSDENGFSIYPNGSSTNILITIDRITRTNPFFTKDFSVNDIDSLPDIYETMIDRPAFIYDTLSNLTSHIFQNLSIFYPFLTEQLNYSLTDAQSLISLTINPVEASITILYNLLSANHQTILSPKRVRRQILPKDVNDDDNDDFLKRAELLEKLSTSSDIDMIGIMRKAFCNSTTDLFHINSSKINQTDLQQRLCRMTPEQYQSLLNLLMSTISSQHISEILALGLLESSAMLLQLNDYIDKLEKYSLFEQGLNDLYGLAQILRTNSCRLVDNSTQSSNQSTTTTTTLRPSIALSGNVESVAMNKLKRNKGFYQLWLTMQESICGTTPSAAALNVDSDTSDDKPPDLAELGISDNQQRQLGLLFYVLYGNSQILYSPNNTLINDVISKANSTFILLDTVTKYANEWGRVSKVLKNYFLANGTEKKVESLRHMKNFIVNYGSFIPIPQLTNISKILKNISDPSVPNYLKQISAIDKAACTWSSLISGINLNVFRGFSDENDLVNYFLRRAYHENYTVLASVVFNNVNMNDTKLPPHVVYKIRQNASLTPSTKRVRDRFWVPSPAQNGFVYYDFGFSWVQEVIDRAIIDTQVGRPVSEPGLFFQEMAYPCYLYDNFLQMIQHALPLCLIISCLYPFAMLTQHIVYEKEVRLKEVMKIMGLSNGVHWVAWFITIFTQTTLVMVAVTLILHYGKVLMHSNPFLIFLILEVYSLATISFAFLISVFYSKAKIAAACSGIIYLLSYVPCMYISIREDLAQDIIPRWTKIMSSLFSTSAFGMGSKYIAFYENIGTGIQFNNIRLSPVEGDKFTCFETVMFMLLDTVIHLILMWYVENVYPGSYGIPKKWYFPFTLNYWYGPMYTEPNWLLKLKQTYLVRIFSRNYIKHQFDDTVISNPNCNQNYFENENTSKLKIGVRIVNLSKVYDRKKFAVQNLSLNLFEDQILSFLGHNGAGKTTTMSILTGLIPASSGYATIYDQDIRVDMDTIRTNLGWCPQHNVLFDKLTVEEHLLFFSKLKQVHSHVMEKMVENMLMDVGLTLKRNAIVSTLSGGMKRKLSVAMAFVGDAKTVILDEPTAGVDP
ncbi:unnamed protein product, partial [Didymodactylos carnosus]